MFPAAFTGCQAKKNYKIRWEQAGASLAAYTRKASRKARGVKDHVAGQHVQERKEPRSRKAHARREEEEGTRQQRSTTRPIWHAC